jgi:hypothetical protein
MGTYSKEIALVKQRRSPGLMLPICSMAIDAIFMHAQTNIGLRGMTKPRIATRAIAFKVFAATN